MDAGPLPRLARIARKRIAPPRYRVPPSHVLRLVSADGTRLHAVRLPRPDGAIASVVLVHGITNSSRTPAVYLFAHQVSTWAQVVVPDLRGHGRSAGACTLGPREADDVAAAVDAAQGHAPDLPVILIGTSLGGVASLLAAGQTAAGQIAAGQTTAGPTRIAAVVAVSAPAYRERTSPGAVRMFRWCESKRGRTLIRYAFRTRVSPAWHEPDNVQGCVAAIAPSLVVVAHDPEDPFFGPEHATTIYEWAGQPKQLWWLPRAGHGGNALTPALAGRIRAEVASHL